MKIVKCCQWLNDHWIPNATCACLVLVLGTQRVFLLLFFCKWPEGFGCFTANLFNYKNAFWCESIQRSGPACGMSASYFLRPEKTSLPWFNTLKMNAVKNTSYILALGLMSLNDTHYSHFAVMLTEFTLCGLAVAYGLFLICQWLCYGCSFNIYSVTVKLSSVGPGKLTALCPQQLAMVMA